MTEVELLKLQIEALEKLVKIKQDTVVELEKQLAMRPLFPALPQINIPSIWQVDQCQHEYPMPWHATVPPHCKKCGKQAPSYTITSTNNSLDGVSQATFQAKANW